MQRSSQVGKGEGREGREEQQVVEAKEALSVSVVLREE